MHDDLYIYIYINKNVKTLSLQSLQWLGKQYKDSAYYICSRNKRLILINYNNQVKSFVRSHNIQSYCCGRHKSETLLQFPFPNS